MLETIAFVLYLIASFGLLLYGLNCYVLLTLFSRKVKVTAARQKKTEAEWMTNHPAGSSEGLPKITTQLPLYNEFNVAERAIRAIAAFDYPSDLHQIQVLDDSTDETRELVDSIAAELREKGVQIDVFRREIRKGYKAGALADAMPSAHGEFIAIFDADFVPEPDFLRRLLPHFTHDKIGLVQARWGHLNREHSLLTKAQSVGIDGHFAIEQTARCTNQLFLNFNGTAGLWRRAAITDAGGWNADTLTEDLDLSYRAQLRGWQLEYVPDVVAPAELPETYVAFKSQQFRWAKGTIQTAIKLIPQLIKSDKPIFSKVQSIYHLCQYIVHPLILFLALLALPSLHYLGGTFNPIWIAIFATPLIASTFGPTVMYIVSQRHFYPDDWVRRVALLPILMLIGFGICISNTKAIFEALIGKKSGFIRTPKRGTKVSKSYNPTANFIPILELTAAAYCAFTVYVYVHSGVYGILPFLSLYVGGFTMIGFASLREQINARKPA